MEVDVSPPKYAKECYKVLALDEKNNRVVSVYDGETQYRVGVTLFQIAEPMHQGGLYCFRQVLEPTFFESPDQPQPRGNLEPPNQPSRP